MSKPGTNSAFLDGIVDGIAIITLDHYPMNAIGIALQNGVTKAIHEIEANPEVKGIVLRGAGRCFCAGADIAEFSNPNKPDKVPLGRDTTDWLGFESMKIPTVAAIHGYALGGGLEIALGCHYRVIDSKATVGLPEVNIGLLPGGQGTQRLPRIMGCDNALKLMTTGNHLKAAKAFEWGVVDHVAPVGTDITEAAIAFCRTKVGQSPRRICELPPPAPVDFDAWRKQMRKKRRGEPAPLAIIQCVEAACKGPTFHAGDMAEKRLFGKILFSKESAALRYMFFAERAGSKVSGLAPGTKPKGVKSVGIIGAGLMGGGIAMCCANIGIPVVLLDINDAAVAKGLAAIDVNYARSVKRGSRTAAWAQKARACITGSTDYNDLRDVDLVVEAVFEDMDVKKQIFAKLDQVCKPEAFLCSNTSALNIDAIAAATAPSRRPRVMGVHFFSPANVMKLLENVRGKDASDETVASMMAWGKRIGKWAILVGNCPGFVGNRMIAHYSRHATRMCLEGAEPKDVDGAALAFGMRMGPLAMGDLVGIDLGVQAIRKRGQFDPKKNLRHALIQAGRCGQKSSAGFFDYKARKAVPSPVVSDLILKVAAANGIKRRAITAEEVVSRLIYPLINEGFKILEEGIAQKPSDIDVCYIHGYSFPRYRGGPMHYADVVGLAKLVDELRAMNEEPASLLLRCVEKKMTLAKFWKKHGADVLSTAKKSNL